MKGSIRSFIPDKQYGFILGEDKKDYFLHASSLKDPAQRSLLCDDAIIEFDPAATIKGYKATNCTVLTDAATALMYIEPTDFMTSNDGSVKGWENIEVGDWIVTGTSRDSPDAARRMLSYNAQRVGANALLFYSYNKTTGSEQGTGSGTHKFTIHNVVGRVATIAKRSATGKQQRIDLMGLNQRASDKKAKLVALSAESRKRRNLVLCGVLGLATTIFFFQISSSAVYTVLFILIVAAVAFFQAEDHDSWLIKR